MAGLHKQKILNIENPRYAALQFLNMMKGELWMQIEFNTKERISLDEVNEYLRDSVDFFIRGYTFSGN
jgi:TetR/AcrR family transcriptional repressor of mexJK operon